MNKLSYLEKLLDGVEVEWLTAAEIFNIKNGYTPSKAKKEFWEEGNIPWFRLEDIRTNGRELNDSIMHVNQAGVKGNLFPKDSIFMSTTATIGEFALVKIPHLTNQQITNFSLTSRFKEIIDIRYLFHRFHHFGEWCKENANKSGGLSIIGIKKLSSYKFPIPCPENPEKSLVIQSEIVRILDKFTALTAELTAELTMRKKQYNYYRDQLLSFKDGEVEWKTLGEITTKILSGRNKIRQTEGDFPVYGSTGLIGYTNESAYSGNLLLVARVGAYAGLVNAVSGNFDVSDNTLIIHPTESWNARFAFHQLTHMNLNQYAVGAGQPLITGGLLKNLKVPFPCMNEQTRIAKILDKFDALSNSLSEGLPREIELRQKQYEYYRDLLFSFPKPEAASN
ncbi:restriction endonuclease subunit S [Edwardsiella tarda]|uniref:restriction endonuclease subunit S n=1 Tax=Edwardsiella tarda TaxID=636 RepID=UPI003F654B63